MASSSSEIIALNGSEDDDDPDICTIKYKKEEKIIKITEELTPQHLATEFDLISIPKFLTYGTKGQLLQCSNPGKPIKPKPGKMYTIPDQNYFDEDKEHVWNAFYCSKAAYEEDPHSFLQNNLRLHNIDSVGVSIRGNQKIVIGGCSIKKTLYVAYRGSVTKEDWETNARISLSTRNNHPGKCHAGFSERADELPASYIVKYATEHGLSTIVTCGHSLGGAVSSVACLNLLAEEVAGLNIFNITFAAPYFCDTRLSNYCKENKFSNRFFHYVNDLDVVPTLLSVSNTIADIQRLLPALSISKEAKSTIERWCPIFSQLGGILIEHIQSTPAVEIAKNFLPIFGQLVSAKFKLNLGDGALDKDTHDYKPMGNYRFLKEKVHYLGDESEVILMLLGIATSMKTHADLTKAFKVHALDSYEKNMEIMRKKPSILSEKCQAVNDIFLPRIDYMEIVWENTDEENQGKCWLSITGEFIHNIDLQTCRFPLTSNFSFNKMDCKIIKRKFNKKEVLDIEKEVGKAEKANIENQLNMSDMGIEVTISTTFGETKFTLMKYMIREMKIRSVEELAQNLPVADLLRRGIHRCIAIRSIKDHYDLSEKNNALLREIHSLTDTICGPTCRLDLQSNQYDLSTFAQKSPIEKMTREVESFFDKPIQIAIENQLRKKMLYIGAAGLMATTGSFAGMAYFVTPAAAAAVATLLPDLLVCGFLFGTPIALFAGIPGLIMKDVDRKVEIEAKYNEALDWYVKEFREIQGGLEISREEENDLNDLGRYETPYAKEATIIRLWQYWERKNPQANIKIPSLILDKFSKDGELKIQEQKRLQCIDSVHKIRVLFGSQCYVGCTGYEDSGKSTLLRKILEKDKTLLNQDIKTGYTKHTSKVNLYPIDDSLTFVDYPGTKGLEDHAEAFRNCGPMNNLIFFLMPFTGDPKEDTYQEIKNAFLIMKVSSSAQIFFCMNKCGSVLEDITAEMKDERTNLEDTPFGKFRKRFVAKLNKRKQTEDTDPSMVFEIDKNNFLFTDWKMGDTEEAKAAGIVGPNSIIEHIKQFLTKKRIYEGKEEKIPSIFNTSSTSARNCHLNIEN